MKVLIIGGGIAGYVTALSLESFGIGYEIYEAKSSTSFEGAGIWLAPNGATILNAIKPSIVEELKTAGKQVKHFGVISSNKKPISIMNMDDIEERFGYRHITLHRGELLKVLEANLTKEVNFSKLFKKIRQVGKKSVVTFEDGTEVEGDVVIGCDGIHSKVREAIFPKVKYRNSGQVCWRAIIDYKVKEDYKDTFYEMWSDKEEGLRVGYSPVNDHQVYTFLTQKKTKELEEKDVKAYLQKTFAHFPFDVSGMVASSNEEDWIKRDLIDIDPMDSWYKGNVVLVGDSAHATTPNLGQGGNQAIESAYSIAKCLSESASTEEAFSVYQGVRKQRADLVTKRSWDMGRLSNMKQNWFKNMLLSLMSKIPKSIIDKTLDEQYTVKV